MGNKAPTGTQQQQQPQPTSGWTTDGVVVSDGWPAPEYVINLDADPKDRWKEIGRTYKTDLKQAMKEINATVPGFVIALVDTFGSELDSLLPPPYGDELRGLAEVTEIPVGELFLFNLAYDITAHCTSIVAQSSDGKLLHARNLDMPDDPQFQAILTTGHATRRSRCTFREEVKQCTLV